MLTCYAEHELANSTLAARVVASSLGDIYGAVTAATAALKGPLHGGANEEAARMFAAIHEHAGDPAPRPPRRTCLARLEAGERVMGFGHRVYMHRADPRAVLLHDDLLALAERRPDAGPYVAAYERAVEVMQREKGLYPNADLPIGLILYLLDIPIELFTPIFLCARAAGLVAHVIEQHDHNRIYRPRVLYEGPFDLHPARRLPARAAVAPGAPRRGNRLLSADAALLRLRGADGDLLDVRGVPRGAQGRAGAACAATGSSSTWRAGSGAAAP